MKAPGGKTPVEKKPVDDRYNYDVLPVKQPGCQKPDYPQAALDRELQGVVLLHVYLDSFGDVIYVKVKESSGHKLLDDAAVAAVQTWKYSPAYRARLPAPSEILVPVRFIIRDPA